MGNRVFRDCPAIGVISWGAVLSRVPRMTQRDDRSEPVSRRPGGRNCSLCAHAERLQIDRELVAGLPYRDIAGRFALSKSAVERHAGEHLAAAVARGGQLRDRLSADSLVAELRVLREVTLGVLEEARAVDNHEIALKAIQRLEKQSELVGRSLGELIDRQRIETVSVVFAEEWLRLRPLIVGA